MNVELLSDNRDAVGESPAWAVAERALYWVDIEGRWLRRWRADDASVTSWPTDERIACIALHGAGGLIAGMENGPFHLRPQDDGSLAVEGVATVAHPRGGMRFNDGCRDFVDMKRHAGRLDRSIEIPAAKPSMCAFGGAALDEIYITSIAPATPVAGYDAALAGAVFVTRPGVTGLAETAFIA